MQYFFKFKAKTMMVFATQVWNNNTEGFKGKTFEMNPATCFIIKMFLATFMVLAAMFMKDQPRDIDSERSVVNLY